MQLNSTDPAYFETLINAASRNLIQLESNLQKLGYKFANKHGAVKLNQTGANSTINELKAKHGRVPRLFDDWYCRFEWVDFHQDDRQLFKASSDSVVGLGLNCTLLFLSLGDLRQRQELLESGGFKCIGVDQREFVPFGSFASNCMPIGVWLPDETPDPIIYDDGGGPVSMGDHIVQCIEAGGFPFWKQMFSKRRISSPIPNIPKYREILADLMHGFAPMR